MIYQAELLLPPFGRGFHLITDIIENNLPALPEQGMVNIFICHTSAGLTINENYDTTVRSDLANAFNKIAPENNSLYDHNSEGSDDMPAHIKATLAGAALNIPVLKHRLGLGTWQGIYLCEFRNHKQKRRIIITIYG